MIDLFRRLFVNDTAKPQAFRGTTMRRHGGSASKRPGGRFINHSTYRRQVRNTYHNSVQTRAIVERFADTVVDVGLLARLGATTLDRTTHDTNGSKGRGTRRRFVKEYKKPPAPPWRKGE